MSATRPPAVSFASTPSQRRDPAREPGSRCSPGRKNISQPGGTSSWCSCQPMPGTGPEAVGDLAARPAARREPARTRRAGVDGAVRVGQHERLLLGQGEPAAAGVELGVAAAACARSHSATYRGVGARPRAPARSGVAGPSASAPVQPQPVPDDDPAGRRSSRPGPRRTGPAARSACSRPRSVLLRPGHPVRPTSGDGRGRASTAASTARRRPGNRTAGTVHDGRSGQSVGGSGATRARTPPDLCGNGSTVRRAARAAPRRDRGRCATGRRCCLTWPRRCALLAYLALHPGVARTRRVAPGSGRIAPTVSPGRTCARPSGRCAGRSAPTPCWPPAPTVGAGAGSVRRRRRARYGAAAAGDARRAAHDLGRGPVPARPTTGPPTPRAPSTGAGCVTLLDALAAAAAETAG